MQKFLFVALMASTVAAQAAVPDPVTAAIAQAQVDAGTVGGAVLLVVLAIATFKWLRRAL
jgi:hypothetical protein